MGKTKIIYEDNDIIVCHKPAGFPVQSAKVSMPDMVSELKAYLKRQYGQSYLGIIHRLDQPVEGLIVFAKNEKAASLLSKSVSSECDMCKYYEAVIWGHMKDKKGTLIDYLEKTNRNMAQVVSKDNTNGKKSILEYEVLDECSFDKELISIFNDLGDKEVERLGIYLKTGRFHQIRAQLSSRGCPLLGDMKYGSEEYINKAKSLGVRHIFLKASRLSFVHPTTGKMTEFTL